MLVREVMTSSVDTVHPDSTVKGAIVLLDKHYVTSMPVVEEHGRIVGVVTEARTPAGTAPGVDDSAGHSRRRSGSAAPESPGATDRVPS